MDVSGTGETGQPDEVKDVSGRDTDDIVPEEVANDRDSLQANSGSTVGDGHGIAAVESAPVDLTRPTDEQILSYENEIRYTKASRKFL